MPNRTPRERLFFALWPDAELVEQIHKAVHKPLAPCDGRRVVKGSYHITLVYYGAADETQRTCLEQAADEVQGPSFQIELSRLGYWPRPRVSWLAPEVVVEPLSRLQSSLSQQLVAKCGYQAEKRAYHPHLTLTRKSKRGPDIETIEPIVWQVERFVLIKSVTRPEGVEYRVVKAWPLGQA